MSVTIQAKSFASEFSFDLPEHFVKQAIANIGDENIIRLEYPRRPFAFTNIIFDDRQADVIRNELEKMSWMYGGDIDNSVNGIPLESNMYSAQRACSNLTLKKYSALVIWLPQCLMPFCDIKRLMSLAFQPDDKDLSYGMKNVQLLDCVKVGSLAKSSINPTVGVIQSNIERNSKSVFIITQTSSLIRPSPSGPPSDHSAVAPVE